MSKEQEKLVLAKEALRQIESRVGNIDDADPIWAYIEDISDYLYIN